MLASVDCFRRSIKDPLVKKMKQYLSRTSGSICKGVSATSSPDCAPAPLLEGLKR